MPEMKTKSNVTAYVSTKNRYFSTLPSCLISLAMQTVKPDKVIVYDDGDKIDLREVSIYKNIFAMFSNSGIEWEVRFGAGKGQVLNHQNALETATTEFLWRLDDDNVAESTALEYLLKAMKPEVGAVGGLVIHPTHQSKLSPIASNKIEDFLLGLNIQWYYFEGQKEVDHIYSTFLYRKEAGKHGYCMELSPVGHNEETMFTYQMKMAGWKLIIEPKALTWHLRDGEGGIRSYNKQELWEHDRQLCMRKFTEWGVKFYPYKFFVLDNGLGDHIVFEKLLPRFHKSHPDHKFVIACCYPEVFDDPSINLISIGDAKSYFGDIDKFNIYRFMWDRNWNKPLEEALWEMYK